MLNCMGAKFIPPFPAQLLDLQVCKCMGAKLDLEEM